MKEVKESELVFLFYVIVVVESIVGVRVPRPTQNAYGFTYAASSE